MTSLLCNFSCCNHVTAAHSGRNLPSQITISRSSGIGVSTIGRKPLQHRSLLGTRTAQHRATLSHVTKASSDERTPPRNTEFGYSRKDVILIGAGITGFGFAMYYGLEAAGLPPATAGNFVQVIVILGLCLGWVSTYFFRVANKEMTYVKQLQDYEEAVMKKRLEELPETEVDQLVEQIESEKLRRQDKQ